MLKVVCAIIINEHKILVTQLSPDSSRALEWEFPGGKINPCESANNAVLREINEELTIEIKICEPMIAVNHNDGEKDFELIPFLCKIQKGEIKLVEHQDMRWVCFDELENINLSEADRKLIQQPGNRLILKKYARKDMNHSC
jgi:8-oxo-dGTP diphosphatase